jgi:predicted short-subunit dehydrogenase-like oxidoreductase (DUF2520 family)
MVFCWEINQLKSIFIMIINIIGAGTLGKTIGNLFVKNKLVKIGGICNTSIVSSMNAITFIGDGKSFALISDLPSADITFITVPDDLILATCDALSKNQFLKTGSIIVHCSGSLSSDALLSVKNKGCYIASIHPMRSFAKPELSIEQYVGTYCAIEGDQEAKLVISTLFNSIGSITYEINKEKKSLYHAAGVMASNYLVTLSKQALLCMEDAGVENEMAMRVITNIMRGTVSNLEKTQSPEQSLTGPIQRSDITTITKHMESFDCEERKNIYATLGKATISLTSHDESKKEELEIILNHKENELIIDI